MSVVDSSSTKPETGIGFDTSGGLRSMVDVPVTNSSLVTGTIKESKYAWPDGAGPIRDDGDKSDKAAKIDKTKAI